MVNKKYLNFTLILIILMLLDVITTQYAISKYPAVQEGNAIMAMVVSSFWLFLLVKAFGTMVIVGMYHKIKQQSPVAAKIGQSIILFMMLLVVGNNLFVINGSAGDNSFDTPTCIQNTFDSGGSIFLITSNNASNGFVQSSSLVAGYFNPDYNRVFSGTNLLCTVSDPSTLGDVSTEHRIFGTTEDGTVYYENAPVMNYSQGFFSPSTPSFGIYKIGSLSATGAVVIRKLAVDSVGNVYVPDGSIIYRFVKASDYSPQIFYTINAGTDYRQGTATGTSPTYYVTILDLKFDLSNNLHLLIGSGAQSVNAGTEIGYLSHDIISSGGVQVGTYTQLDTVSKSRITNPTHAEFIRGGLILESTNTSNNITVAAVGIMNGGSGDSYQYSLKHYSSTTGTSIATLTGITDIGDIGYYSNQIYLTSPAQNLIRSYATSYVGLAIPVSVTSPAGLVYQTSFVNSVYPTYYNNSQFQFAYGIAYTATVAQQAIYSHRIDVLDPNSATIATKLLSDVCETPSLTDFLFPQSYNCAAYNNNGLTVTSVSAWTNGTYTVKLFEHNSSSGGDALLDSDTFTVLNQSGNLGATISSDPDITGVNSTATITQWDGLVGLLGFGVSSVSKLLFALLIITLVGVVALWFGKRGDIAGLVMFAPYIFFTYIGYIPKWIFIVVIMVVIVISKLFR